MIRRLLLLGALVLPLLALLGWNAQRSLSAPMQVPGTGYLLDVPAGSSLQSVAARLEEEGILASPWLLSAYGRLTGTAGNIKAGEYEIVPGHHLSASSSSLSPA